MPLYLLPGLLDLVDFTILFPSQRNFFYSNRSINKEIGLLWSRQSFGESTISDFESPSNFQVKEKKIFKSVKKQRNYALIKNAKIVMFKWTLGSGESSEDSTISDLESPLNFLRQRKKNYWNRSRNNKIMLKTTKLDWCGQDSHFRKVQYRILNPH